MAGTTAGAAKRVQAQRSAQEIAQQATGKDPSQVMETWEITTEGRVWFQTTTYNRFGQPQDKDVSLGPKKMGARIKISQADRERNQEMAQSPEFDAFTNGLLVRVDADQNANPKTASTDALSTADLLAIYEKRDAAFREAVEALGQVPIRRLREMAEAVDASMSQVAILDEVIEERYRKSSSQPDAVFDLSGQRRPEREGK